MTDNFGKLLRQLRLEKGITLYSLKAKGFSPGNLSKLERGINRPPRSWKEVERLLSDMGLSNEYSHVLCELAIEDHVVHIRKKFYDKGNFK